MSSGPTTALPSGSVIADRYKVEDLLGMGGFGITYRAFDSTLHRTVAIKELFTPGAWRESDSLRVVSAQVDGHRTAAEQFVREGRLLAQFSDASIVKVHDSFEANGTAYLVMELLVGETLETLVQRQGPLTPESLKRLASQLSAALREIHRHGLLHQDVSPSNVIMVDQGRLAVLIDFGSARNVVAERSYDLARIVKAGFSPLEQYAGGSNCSPKTDVYALAATLYFAATANVPADATARATGSVLIEPMTLSASIGSAVSSSIVSGLALDPAKRPSLEEFDQSLSGRHNQSKTVLLTDPSSKTFPISRERHLPSTKTGSRGKIVTSGLVGLVVLLVGAVLTLLLRPAEPPDGPVPSTTIPQLTTLSQPEPSSIVSTSAMPQPELSSITSPSTTLPSAITTLPYIEREVIPDSPVARTTIGQSVRGLPIQFESTGSGSSRVLVVGGLSGELVSGPGVAARLVELVSTTPDLAQRVTIGAVLDPNPDGRSARQRENSSGVDLNRNFPAADFRRSSSNGPSPLSEPESVAVNNAILEFRPTLVISLVGTARTGFTNFDGPGQSIAATFASRSGYSYTPSDHIAPTPGSLGHYVGVDNNVPMLVVAFPKALGSTAAWGKTSSAFIAVLRSL